LLYNWLANKTTVEEHFVFMFNNEILADVHFKVILLQLFSIIGNHSVFGVIHFEVIVQIVQQQTVIKVGLLYNWLATKTTVKEHFAFMFNNEILADVHFKVILLQLFSIIGNHSVFGVILFEVIVQIVQQQTVIMVGLLYNWLANKTIIKERFALCSTMRSSQMSTSR
jgi:hypothetical protein